MKSRAGIGLGMTLMVCSLLLVIGFALSALSVSQLQRVSASEHGRTARNLADSVISRGIAQVLETPGFGKTGVEVLTVPGPAGALGELRFFAPSPGVPESTNNLETTQAVAASDGTAVSAACVRLIGVGRCQGQVRRVEAILHEPPFPYAIAGGGAVELTGQLNVAGVGKLEDVPFQDRWTLPADVGANGRAIELEGAGTITGNLRAVGQVLLRTPSTTKVLGQAMSGSEAIRIPTVTLGSYDPAGDGLGFDKVPPQGDHGLVLGGRTRHQGPLVVNGNLTLDSGLLFVEGDLTITGGVKGYGAIIATGDVKVTRAASLEAGNRLAVLAGGDVTLLGSGSHSSYVQGLVYAGGAFRAEHVTVVGSLIARGSGGVKVVDASLVSVPEYRSVDMDVRVKTTFDYRDERDPAGMMWTVKPARAGSKLTLQMDSNQVPSTGKNVTLDISDANIAATDLSRFLNLGNQVAHHEVRVNGGGGIDMQSGLLADRYMEVFRAFETAIPEGPTDETKTVPFRYEPNLFLRPEDRLRIALWRDLN